MTNNNIKHLENYQYDYFCGVINHCLQDPELPVTYSNNDESDRIRPLVEYILELAPFEQTEIKPTPPKTGYVHGIAFIDELTQTILFTISYGGKQQNGTVCIEVKGLHAETVTPVLFRHFQFRTTRVDVAINYDGDYQIMHKQLVQITGDNDPRHIGNNEGGHTYSFGSRNSTTYTRHYQWGLYHFPKTPEKHTINRIELEYKPQDKNHKLAAQHLSKEQLFLRSNNGRKIHEYLFSKLTKIKLVSDKRTPDTDTIERIKSMAIRNRNIFTAGLIATSGDMHQLISLILDTISEHEHRQKTA
jgi:hypothetical protein